MSKNDYNTENTPLEDKTNEEIEALVNPYFEGIRYIEITKWQRFKMWVKRLFRRKTNFEKHLEKNPVKFIYELEDENEKRPKE